MQQTYIVFTQSFVDSNFLDKYLSYCFFDKYNLSLPRNLKDKIDNNTLDLNFNRYLSSGQIIKTDFNKKKDFSSEVLDYYQQYTKPTILFLGDLSEHSELMQEGMLKLLEEPPKNLFIILLAKDHSQLLETITSRSRFVILNKKIIHTNLDNNLSENVQKKFPKAGDFSKKLLTQKVSLEVNYTKLERKEIQFWLWQIESCLIEIYKEKPEISVAQTLQKVLQAKKLNTQNVQKKFALEYLFT